MVHLRHSYCTLWWIFHEAQLNMDAGFHVECGPGARASVAIIEFNRSTFPEGDYITDRRTRWRLAYSAFDSSGEIPKME